MAMDPDLKKNLSHFSLTVSEQVREVKTLVNGNKRTLDSLGTVDKTNLVRAINEVLAIAQANNLENIDIAVQDYFVLHPQSFTYEQVLPTLSVLIVHPLDHYPAVTASDSAGTIWRGQVSYPDQNKVLVQFNVPFAGPIVLT